jgi:hypothetical protein
LFKRQIIFYRKDSQHRFPNSMMFRAVDILEEKEMEAGSYRREHVVAAEANVVKFLQRSVGL